MSTCQGAPAPHENCQHGDRCDWNGGKPYNIVRDFPNATQPGGMNRADRRAAARGKR